MIQVNAIGDACPIPVVKTLNALKGLGGAGTVQTLVDNEIAVQNLTRLAESKGCTIETEKRSEKEFCVTITTAGAVAAAENEEISCIVPAAKKKTVVVVSADHMGEGGEELGRILIKGFLFALTQQEHLPSTVLFYNGGAKLTTEGSASLEDLKTLEANGVEILTCGTCLDYYGLKDKLAVGGVTNMYVIVEKQMQADLVLRP
ncbi:sulfurtransferase-like selenium metabolism protein YedF [Agathobaculum sp.]|uniref:sulfurtransferase-like selenium metabolism protein YedF n=1 Tax=Agathobaculum sp. TaxID=2048138 RepID=UPI003AF1B256